MQTKSTEIAFGEKVIVSIDFACEYCMVSMIRDLSNTKQYTCIDKKTTAKNTHPFYNWQPAYYPKCSCLLERLIDNNNRIYFQQFNIKLIKRIDRKVFSTVKAITEPQTPQIYLL